MCFASVCVCVQWAMCTGESWRYCSHFAMATGRDAYCNSEIYVSHFRHTLNCGNGMQLHVRRFTVNVSHLKLHRMWTMYPIPSKSIDKVNRRFAFGCFSYCKWLLHERSHIEWDCVHRPMWMMTQRASERVSELKTMESLHNPLLSARRMLGALFWQMNFVGNL